MFFANISVTFWHIIGEEAGELDSFVRFLVMRLLNSLKGKALNYVRDGRDDSQVCYY